MTSQGPFKHEAFCNYASIVLSLPPRSWKTVQIKRIELKLTLISCILGKFCGSLCKSHFVEDEGCWISCLKQNSKLGYKFLEFFPGSDSKVKLGSIRQSSAVAL